MKNIGIFNDRSTSWRYYWTKKNSHAFIRNVQLDGATDWEFRKAQGIIHQKEEINIFQNRAYAQYEPPSKLIYNFQDIIHTGKRKEGLNLEKT